VALPRQRGLTPWTDGGRPAASALQDGAAAAARAGVAIRTLEDLDDLIEVDRLLSRIWTGPEAGPDAAGQDVVSMNLMRALAHTGNYVVGAYSEGRLVGASVAFVRGDRPALHSHVTGVEPGRQRSGIGLALKLHQAGWARARGLTEITWTFDPLIARNARFNLVTLGARAVSYHPDHYGRQNDRFGQGLVTDRCLITWDVADPPPPAGGGDRAEPSTLLRVGPGDGPVLAADLPAAGGRSGAGLGPPAEARLGQTPRPLLCQIPEDIVALRRTDPDRARSWQPALRRTLGAALAAGYRATSFTPDHAYLLEGAR
jgi:predicted GNAT superfamily acetyltransferase